MIPNKRPTRTPVTKCVTLTVHSAIVGTVVFGYGGLVFIRGALPELADHQPGMMTLISLTIIVAFGTSLAATFGLFAIDVSRSSHHSSRLCPRPLAGNA